MLVTGSPFSFGTALKKNFDETMKHLLDKPAKTSPHSITRRTALKKFSLGFAGVALATSGNRAWAQASDFVPAVVIGSGFGGAVAALRLGQAGIDTVVL